MITLARELDRIEVKAIPTNGPNVLVVSEMAVPGQAVLEDALARPRVADFFATVLADLPSQNWAVASAITHIVTQWLQHREVGTAVGAARRRHAREDAARS